jgi:hypothetical protein
MSVNEIQHDLQSTGSIMVNIQMIARVRMRVWQKWLAFLYTVPRGLLIGISFGIADVLGVFRAKSEFYVLTFAIPVKPS